MNENQMIKIFAPIIKSKVEKIIIRAVNIEVVLKDGKIKSFTSEELMRSINEIGLSDIAEVQNEQGPAVSF